MVKGLLRSPGRTWRKSTGDPILMHTINPIRTRTGDKIITEGTAIIKSKKRLKEGGPKTGNRKPRDGEGDPDDILKFFLSDLYKIMKHCRNLPCRFQQLVTGCFIKNTSRSSNLQSFCPIRLSPFSIIHPLPSRLRVRLLICSNLCKPRITCLLQYT